MYKDKRFIVLAPNCWNGQWMNRQQLFSRIGKFHDVLYSTGPFLNWDMNTERFQNAPLISQIELQDNVSVLRCSKLLCSVMKIKPWTTFVNQWVGRKINAFNQTAKSNCLYVFHPKFYSLIRHINHSLLVYHLYDDLSLQAGYKFYKEDDERLLHQADVIICSSRLLKQKIENRTGRSDVLFLPNGVHFDAFNHKKSMPPEYAYIESPRITYTGSINEKVDLKLLLTLAKRMSHANFVLVGEAKENKIGSDIFRALKEAPNIHLLGFRDKADMVRYIQHSDVNIMIYKTDDSTWSKYIYPLKMHEYLATGKPVVSSNIDAVTEFNDVINIATDEDQWIELLNMSLQETSFDNARVLVAKNNDWDNRVDTLLKHIDNRL